MGQAIKAKNTAFFVVPVAPVAPVAGAPVALRMAPLRKHA